MSYYDEVYLKRLNRYGNDFQTRRQGQREKNFEDYLLKSAGRVDFEYNADIHPAVLERYKQDYSQTQCYLLTRLNLKIPSGTILSIADKNDVQNFWMVWWPEYDASSGYNRYVVLKMSNMLTWRNNGVDCAQWSYFSGPGTQRIQDAIKSSSDGSLYTENNNLHMYITPYNKSLKKEVYLEVERDGVKNGFTIMEVDNQSTPGVSYVSVDPTPIKLQDAVEQTDSAKDYWLNGGN